MSVYLELRDGRPNLEESSKTPGVTGPVIGPFLSVRLLGDELRLSTKTGEARRIERVADWVIYAGFYWADIEVIPESGIGPRRRARIEPFKPQSADINPAV